MDGIQARLALSIKLMAVAALVTGAVLTIRRHFLKAEWRVPPQSDVDLRAGLGALRNLYEDRGFYLAAVQAHRAAAGLEFTVVLGSIWRFGALQVEGVGSDAREKLTTSFPLKTGDVYKPNTVSAWLEPLRKEGVQAAAGRVFLRRVTVTFDHAESRLDLKLGFASSALAALPPAPAIGAKQGATCPCQADHAAPQ